MLSSAADYKNKIVNSYFLNIQITEKTSEMREPRKLASCQSFFSYNNIE